ncbi:MAG: hypothetical protein DMG56_04280 [Acidobacteria bacterium]|nr:MAG: hypothetical protein DMG56_04280 [Acidobacteriota bacterium]
MKITTRLLAFLVLVLAPLALLSSAPAPKRAAAKKGQYLAYVGTYTTKTSSKGIYVFGFDTATGQPSAIEVAAATPDPSWVAVHPSGKFLYAAREEREAHPARSDSVAGRGSLLFVVRQNREVRSGGQLQFGDHCRFSDFGGWPAGRTHRARERSRPHGSEQRAAGSAARALD